MSVVWITQKHTKKKTKKRKNLKKQKHKEATMIKKTNKQSNKKRRNEKTKKQQIKQRNEKTKKQRNMPIWHHPFHHGTHFLFLIFFDLHRSGGGAFIGNRSEFCSCDLAFSSESDDQIIPLWCFCWVQASIFGPLKWVKQVNHPKKNEGKSRDPAIFIFPKGSWWTLTKSVENHRKTSCRLESSRNDLRTSTLKNTCRINESEPHKPQKKI